MRLGERNLNDVITHWTNTGSNGFGGYNFGTPILLNGRWEDEQELFTAPDGTQEVSNAKVFLDADVQIGDYIAEGDLTADADPTPDTVVAWRVKQFMRNTNLRKLSTERKAML